ncbi:hypothetical protein SCUCBS95973_008106 [Sporothrix curviconia]|uniref:Uncharacterized protein n=1 Tax=Sporothrix curviconia TaxID=1260050 RepID=A0ABP0CJE4_9PEZI
MDDADVDMYDAPPAGADHDGGQSEAGTVVTAVTAVTVPSAASDAPSTASRPRLSGHHILHRRKSVYDAVAGRVRTREPRPLKWPGQPLKYRNTMLAPEEALFRAANAPERYEETDTYFAHENLEDGVLPPSDLVKAVHHYTSHYYEALARRQGMLPGVLQRADLAAAGGLLLKKERPKENKGEEQGEHMDGQRQKPKRLVDERSMDETALLAFGILLEEAGREVLGADGALVFTEAEEGEGEKGEKEEQDGENGQNNATAKKSGPGGKKRAGKKTGASGQHP